MNNLNVHPIFVHFPVALLTIYCLLEFVRLRKVTSQPYWFYIKAMFVIIGSLATAAALITGDMAEDIVAGSDRALRHLIGVHSNWAVATTTIFGMLAFFYLIAWIEKQLPNFLLGNPVWKFLLTLKHF